MGDISSPELVKQPIVEVKYDRMDLKDSLFQIDGSAMGQAIVDLGYSPSIVKPLIIDNDEQAYELAHYDYTKKAVVFHQKSFIDAARKIYRGVLEEIGEAAPQTITQENNLLHNMVRSRFFQTVFPPFWPYHMVKNRYRDFFAGNPHRRENYLKAAKEGSLMPGKPLEEQRARAQAFMEKLMERALQRYSSWTFAHEYEHIHHGGRKFALKTTLGAIPLVASLAILDAIIKQMQQVNMSASDIETAMLLGIIGAGGVGLLGLAMGRSKEEQASYDAGYKNMSKYMECFKVNREVFAREVLGKVESAAKTRI